MYDRMAIAPTGHPQMPNMLYLWQFFRAFPFPPLYSLLFPTLSLSLHHFSISSCPSRSPGRWTKKLSYRRPNALSIIKTHESNSVSEYCLNAYASLEWRVTLCCRSVRLSVRLFVRFISMLYFENEWTDFNTRAQVGLGHERSTSAVRRSKVKVAVVRL